MENRREVIAKKIDNFAFNIKNINRIIAFMTVLFIIFCFVVYKRQNEELKEREEVYSKMLAELEAHQLNVIYSNVTPNNGQVISNEKESAMFKNGTEAIIYAFDKFFSYKTYESQSSGRVTAQAAGQNVEVVTSIRNARFADGAEFDEVVRKETKTNFGQTDAVQIVYKNNKKYTRKGSNIREQAGRWIADFNSSFEDVTQSITEQQFYVVNEETVRTCRDYSFTRTEDGKIEYYKVSAILDPVKATYGYAKNMQEEGGTSFPEFSRLEISCIIGRDGHLLSYNVLEKMTLSKKIVIDITTTMTMETTTIILSHDKTPNISEPQI